MRRLAIVSSVLLARLLDAQGTNPQQLALRISTETVPAGGVAHVKVFLEAPRAITAATLAFTLDGAGYPNTPPPIESAAVFSVNGDATAVGAVNRVFAPFGLTIWARSPAGGIGRVPGVPIAQFSIPVGGPFSASLNLSRSGFVGPAGAYSATVAPGGVIAGGTLAIRRASLSGTELTIEGSGFAPGATVLVGGAAISGARADPDRIRVTLPGTADLTGRQIEVRNPGGERTTYWIAPEGMLLTFPAALSTRATCLNSGPALRDPMFLALFNPNAAEAEASITNVVTATNPAPATVTARIAASGVFTTNINDPADSTFQSPPAAPLRALCYGTTRSPEFSLLQFLPIVYRDAPPPTIGWLANAATLVPGAVSPGEIVTVFGTASWTGAAQASGIRLLFDGAPAQIHYASATQVNAVVPQSAAAGGTVRVELESAGLRSAPWIVPVAAANPGIFALDGSGLGQGAVLNQDNSVNGPANPAARGSVLQIYGTGGGPAIPGDDLNRLSLPVTLTIGGANATVLYAGYAPGSAAGLLQVNAIIPSGVTPGDAVPVRLGIGTAAAPANANVTVAVR